MKTFGMLVLAMLCPCPCHLPLLLALLGGTTIGTLLLANVLPVAAAMSVMFVAILVFGLRAFGTGSRAACALGDESTRH